MHTLHAQRPENTQRKIHSPLIKIDAHCIEGGQEGSCLRKLFIALVSSAVAELKPLPQQVCKRLWQCSYVP